MTELTLVGPFAAGLAADAGIALAGKRPTADLPIVAILGPVTFGNGREAVGAGALAALVGPDAVVDSRHEDAASLAGRDVAPIRREDAAGDVSGSGTAADWRASVGTTGFADGSVFLT
jgi:hypothetical protein